jgi:hypothetical protein
MNVGFKVVYVGNGKLDAEIIKIFLEASGVEAFINQEGVMQGYSLNVGPLSEVWVCVPDDKYDTAMELIKEMQAGTLETNENLDKESSEDPGTQPEEEG